MRGNGNEERKTLHDARIAAEHCVRATWLGEINEKKEGVLINLDPSFVDLAPESECDFLHIVGPRHGWHNHVVTFVHFGPPLEIGSSYEIPHQEDWDTVLKLVLRCLLDELSASEDERKIKRHLLLSGKLATLLKNED
ncbi:MAG: hypothetical protein IT292_01995 [Deltaproteobacteria bacterium]|nr:hypothetical protein [Deltaproteobacteria bacterium]